MNVWDPDCSSGAIAGAAFGSTVTCNTFNVRTNLNAQVQYSESLGSNGTFSLSTISFTDDRGKNA